MEKNSKMRNVKTKEELNKSDFTKKQNFLNEMT